MKICWPVVAFLAVAGCGIPETPTSATPAPPAAMALNRIAILSTPAELPVGGGTAQLRIETGAGGSAAAGVLVILRSSTGTLARTEVTTDHTGHASVEWQGDQSTAITATAGSVVGTFDLTVVTPTPTPTPSTPPPPIPTPPPSAPLPAPPAQPTADMTAAGPNVPAGVGQRYTASVNGLAGNERVLSYVWLFEGQAANETTAGPSVFYAYATHGVKTARVTASTSAGRTAAGSMQVVVISQALR